MIDVFLSCTEHELELARRVATLLEARACSAWRHRRRVAFKVIAC